MALLCFQMLWLRRQHVVSRQLLSVTLLLLLQRGKDWETHSISSQWKKYSTVLKSDPRFTTQDVSDIKFCCLSISKQADFWSLYQSIAEYESTMGLEGHFWSADTALNIKWLWRVQFFSIWVTIDLRVKYSVRISDRVIIKSRVRSVVFIQKVVNTAGRFANMCFSCVTLITSPARMGLQGTINLLKAGSECSVYILQTTEQNRTPKIENQIFTPNRIDKSMTKAYYIVL